ncbi:STAS/SEC14 domain-containing protein [uncultured Pontibacter sp.]|uniref:STAS/SEC14 domain-containing protein n=1 Tax=uncultured Pontibacter sp. TaxID=453356 RepID=UPI00262266D0|nr:STAS/SEC14 domain-containing protein [uncultured Pontibacter sp.]
MPSTPYINIELNPEYNLVQSQWLRAVDSAEYRRSLKKTYDAIKVNSVVCWLADITRLSSPNMIDQKWTAELLGKRMSATRLRKIALVLPDDLFLEVVVEKIGEQVVRMTKNQIQIAYFNSHASAFQWLLSRKDSEGLFREDIS